MSEPKWTVTKKEVKKTDKFGWKIGEVTAELRFEGSPVHSLSGGNAENILQKQADEYNEKGYEPKFVKAKLLPEMTQAQREDLAYKMSQELPITKS